MLSLSRFLLKYLFLVVLLSIVLMLLHSSITIRGMEDDQKCPFPWSAHSASSMDLQPPDLELGPNTEEEEELDQLSYKAIDVCFDSLGSRDIRHMTFSKELFSRVQSRLKEKSEERLTILRMFETPPTPPPYEENSEADVQDLKNMVMDSLEDAFTEKEKMIMAQQQAIRAHKNRLKIAILGAGTTVFTTLTAAIVTLLVSFS